ncbi:MAG: hypothetical protein LBU34_02910 [Planctomycetaceae bacterium]|nr:hypothetical protein [Planctomycetaceae bacterium]
MANADLYIPCCRQADNVTATAKGCLPFVDKPLAVKCNVTAGYVHPPLRDLRFRANI